ncbi:MAG: hypothetical protein CVU54_13865 [Deltaproteobacteria bacterium HGW-Deltaproteobacteria-12]|jgi:purine-cytosine permease-like protein|nr:MAG: hypothetical protein CVU54_13865 [Deltaproteobacteria bacterium HGW-Deltaproteobacteria-12]
MKGIAISIFSLICAIAVIMGIKMMNLPALITALLVVVVVMLQLLSMAKGFSKNESTKRQSTETRTNDALNQKSPEN